MSLYTTELRYICENYAGYNESQDFPEIDTIVENSRRKIFGDYPIFDEEYRPILEKKILKHYYTREISEETVGLWKLRLNNTMNEIMPYYNQLYESETIKFDPLGDYDIKIEHTGEEARHKLEVATHDNATEHSETEIKTGTEIRSQNENDENARIKSNNMNENTTTENVGNTSDSSLTSNDGHETATGSTTGKKTDRYSDTPQGGLNGMNNASTGMQNIEANTYLTNARIIDDSASSTQNTEKTSNENTHNEGHAETSENKDKNRVESENETERKVKTKDEENNTQHTGNKNIRSAENGNRSNNTSLNTTNDYIERRYGKNYSRSFSSLLMEFRKTFINIDMMIIEELQSLFFGLWG